MDSITRNLAILITALAWICAIGSHYTPHDSAVPQWLIIATVIVATTFWVVHGVMKLNGFFDDKTAYTDDDFKIVEREREAVLSKIAEKETHRRKDVFDFSVAQQKEINRKRRNKRKAAQRSKRQQQGR